MNRFAELLTPWQKRHLDVEDAERLVTNQRKMLPLLQGSHVYGGTVPTHVIAKRRARNKQARLSRRINRRTS